MALRNQQFEAPGDINLPAKNAGQSRFGTDARKVRSQIAVETIEQFSRFEELEPYWNDLFRRSPSPGNVFRSFNWHWHWCNRYLNTSGSILRIVAVWSDERLIMVWPLIIVRSFGVRQLKWMGAPVSQYGDVLIDAAHNDGELLGHVWNYIIRHIRADVIALEKVRDDGPVADLLKNRKAIVTGCMEAPSLDLASAGDFETYERRYSGRTRKNRRRHRRRLAELGPLHFDVLTEGVEAQEMVGRAISCKRDWLKSKGLVSRAFADPRFDAFFTDVAGSVDRPTGCIVGLLYSGSKPVAYDISFKSDTVCVAHIGAYDLAYERFGPGGILTQDSIRHSFKLGIGLYDFLAPKTEHKMSWADKCVPVCDYAYPISGIGLVYARGVLWFVRNLMKNILEHLPAGARRLTRPFFRFAGY